MPGNTKAIKTDVDLKPSPQYFNPVADAYEYLYGRNGASRVEIYGPDGNPISTAGNKLAVRASEIETLLEAIEAKDFATQTTLAAILAQLGTTGLKKIIDAVDIGDRAERVLGKVDATLTGSSMDLRGTAANKPLAAAVTIGATYWSVDTDPNADALEVSNGTEWVVIK